MKGIVASNSQEINDLGGEFVGEIALVARFVCYNGWMKITEAEIDKYLALLGETVGRIDSAVSHVDSAELTAVPPGDEWSVNHILAHLRACVDVWGDTIERMLAVDEPTLGYLSPRTYIRRTDYYSLDFEASFSTFKAEREMLLAKLQSLTFEEWQRGAEIKGRRHTIFSQVRRMALHEAGHCEQIEGMIKAVG